MALLCAGRGGGLDWTASPLLMNIITFWTQYNIKMCAYTLINDGAQQILVYSCSRVPRSWALTRFLTNSRIFPFSAHLTIIFAYIESPWSLLLSYLHFIFMFYLLPMSARFVCGIVVVGAYELVLSHPAINYHNTQWHLLDTTKAHAFDLWRP